MLVFASVATLTSVLALAPDGPDDFYEPPMLEIAGPPPCSSDRDCPWEDQPFCHPDTEQCSACLVDEHCDEGWSCNPNGICFDYCETDEDCEGRNDQSTCDTTSNECVQCLSSDDCPAEEYCSDRYCYADHCEPGELMCLGNTLMECLEDGGSTAKFEDCFPKCIRNENGDDECLPKGGDGGLDTGGDGTPPGTTGSTATTGPDPTSGGNPATSGATAPQGDSTGDAASGSGSGGAGGVSGRGCSCTTDGDEPTLPWGGLGLLVLLAIRRRH